MANRLAGKVVILVLSSDEEPWRTWERTQAQLLRTQIEELKCSNVRLLWFQGISKSQSGLREIFFVAWLRLLRLFSLLPFAHHLLSRVRLAPRNVMGRASGLQLSLESGSLDILRVGLIEDYGLMGVKTLAALRFVLQDPEVSYVFRTNSSSCIDIGSLVQCLETVPRENLYGGHPLQFGCVSYVSGSGILLSRDAAQLLVAEEDSLRLDLIDDVAFGEVLLRLGLEIYEFPRSDYPDFPAASDDKVFHFRCKSGVNTPQTMIAMHERRKSILR